ncbi:MAG TPA: isoprenylcysteine carboxylmethyltransferase family protein [Terriglobia bacterium]|nr:isoprenylcysteine carboxylmethyltransferase family protein [Terriglobia bacterium]
MGLRQGVYSAWAARWRVPLGFALSAAYLVFAQPTPRLLIVGGAVALAGVGLRAWAAGYLEKGSILATAGPYALTRNPLYLGSTLIGAGFALAGRSIEMAAAFAALLVLVYVPVIRREARFLSQKFGKAYEDYAERVPLLFPRLAIPPASDAHFSWSRYRKNREYEAALGYVAGLCLVALKMLLMLR